MKPRRPALSSERGQTLIIFVAMISLVFIAAAIAIDYGFWLSERRGLARATDLAALAAVQDLPEDNPNQEYTSSGGGCAALPSCEAAHTWATRNGYGEADGAFVTVAYFCSNDIDNPPSDICFNENQDVAAFPLSVCPSETGEMGCDTVRVIVEKEAGDLFGSFFGGADFDIGSSSFSRVQFVVSPVDVVITIDSSGSMDFNCNSSQTNPGCPIKEARDASANFATTILGDDPDTSVSQVGYVPYKDCYANNGGCVPSIPLPPSNGDCANPGNSWVLCLDNDLDLIQNRIAGTQTGNSTNICMGLFASGEIMDGPNSRDDVDRIIVILTDGANVFNGHPSVPQECWPDDAGGSCGAAATTNAGGAVQAERELDYCTRDMADDLKAAGYEIYVVGLNVENGPNLGATPTNAFCNGIGNDQDDDVADRRLLKCMASSADGTNDHYFETNDASTLGNIFQGIAYDIAARGLTSAGD